MILWLFYGLLKWYKAKISSRQQKDATKYVDKEDTHWILVYIIRKNNEGGSEHGKIQVYGDDYLTWLTAEDHPLSFTEKAPTGIENKNSLVIQRVLLEKQG